MTAGISLISGKTGAHRAPLQLLDPSFPQPARATARLERGFDAGRQTKPVGMRLAKDAAGVDRDVDFPGKPGRDAARQGEKLAVRQSEERRVGKGVGLGGRG